MEKKKKVGRAGRGEEEGGKTDNPIRTLFFLLFSPPASRVNDNSVRRGRRVQVVSESIFLRGNEVSRPSCFALDRALPFPVVLLRSIDLRTLQPSPPLPSLLSLRRRVRRISSSSSFHAIVFDPHETVEEEATTRGNNPFENRGVEASARSGGNPN